MPPAEIVAHGPDGKEFVHPDGTTYEQIAAQLTAAYGRTITVGYRGEVLPFSSQMWAQNDVQHTWLWALSSVILGLLVFVVTWTIGWIIAGFAGDGEEVST